jgi:uncharacterized membrane protein
MTWYPWFSLVIVIFAGIVCLTMPRFSRPDIFFGVTVQPAFRQSPEGSSIARRYRMHMLLSVTLAVLLTVASATMSRPVLSTVSILVVVAASVIALASANRQARAHAVPASLVREASLVIRKDRLPGGWMIVAIPFLILVASGVYLHARWDEIPNRFPIHFDMNGQPNGWANKSAISVYGMLGMGAGICLMMAIMAFSIMRTRRVALRGSAARYEQRFRSTSMWAMLAAEYFMAILFAAIPVVSIFHSDVSPIVVLNLVFTAGLLLTLVPLLFYYGQGGTGMAGDAALTDPPVGDRTPDQCWTWGMFYYNPDDPAIMVEKRFGIGYTMNFGNVWSWVILGALLLLPIAGVFIARG